ncbi:hypothetical protein HYC85_026013 [Camellia sinensis]|uniref:Uncharacterized protein n=1 Tax=Camellia sinensis TaxID=4442 RepID=A0A7J7G6A9_CAMSI|nr:hypothetical protein HYC85_026013 [Camellia sinensis]
MSYDPLAPPKFYPVKRFCNTIPKLIIKIRIIALALLEVLESANDDVSLREG